MSVVRVFKQSKEVFVDPARGESLIIELLEMKYDLATEQSAEGNIVTAQSKRIRSSRIGIQKHVVCHNDYYCSNGGGIWDRGIVVHALRVAFNNPERAIISIMESLSHLSSLQQQQVLHQCQAFNANRCRSFDVNTTNIVDFQ